MTTQNERFRKLLIEAIYWLHPTLDETDDIAKIVLKLCHRIDAALSEPVKTGGDISSRLRAGSEAAPWVVDAVKVLENERDEALDEIDRLRDERDKLDADAYLAQTRLQEIVELVGEGGDGTAFGSVESMLTTHKHVQEILQQQLDEARAEVGRLARQVDIQVAFKKIAQQERDEARAEIERLRKVLDERWYECHDGSEESCCKNH
jgi:hypothetical protein